MTSLGLLVVVALVGWGVWRIAQRLRPAARDVLSRATIESWKSCHEQLSWCTDRVLTQVVAMPSASAEEITRKLMTATASSMLLGLALEFKESHPAATEEEVLAYAAARRDRGWEMGAEALPRKFAHYMVQKIQAAGDPADWGRRFRQRVQQRRADIDAGRVGPYVEELELVATGNAYAVSTIMAHIVSELAAN